MNPTELPLIQYQDTLGLRERSDLPFLQQIFCDRIAQTGSINFTKKILPTLHIPVVRLAKLCETSPKKVVRPLVNRRSSFLHIFGRIYNPRVLE